jgi:hypothetical protein
MANKVKSSHTKFDSLAPESSLPSRTGHFILVMVDNLCISLFNATYIERCHIHCLTAENIARHECKYRCSANIVIQPLLLLLHMQDSEHIEPNFPICILLQLFTPTFAYTSAFHSLPHLMLMFVAGNDTLLSTLGLQNINLNVSALLPASTCPNGGLLNAALGLGNNCLGITVAGSNGLAQICALQNNTCCCSSGETLFSFLLPLCRNPII